MFVLIQVGSAVSVWWRLGKCVQTTLCRTVVLSNVLCSRIARLWMFTDTLFVAGWFHWVVWIGRRVGDVTGHRGLCGVNLDTRMSSSLQLTIDRITWNRRWKYQSRWPRIFCMCMILFSRFKYYIFNNGLCYFNDCQHNEHVLLCSKGHWANTKVTGTFMAKVSRNFTK